MPIRAIVMASAAGRGDGVFTGGTVDLERFRRHFRGGARVIDRRSASAPRSTSWGHHGAALGSPEIQFRERDAGDCDTFHRSVDAGAFSPGDFARQRLPAVTPCVGAALRVQSSSAEGAT